MQSTVIYQSTSDNTQIDEIHQICLEHFPNSNPWRLSDSERVHGEYGNTSYCLSISEDGKVFMLHTTHGPLARKMDGGNEMNNNPLEVLLADKKKNLRKFKTLDAYIAHLKALPSPDDLLKQLEAKAGKKAEPIEYLLLDMNFDEADDPLEEIRANKRTIRKQYKTIDAYLAHAKNIPSADELLRQVRATLAKQIVPDKATKAKTRPASKKQRDHSKT